MSKKINNSNNIKEEFAKVVFRAKIIAGIFFLFLTPSIVMMVKDIELIYGQDKEFWLNIAIAGFIIYGLYYLFLWKCPKCGSFPGRGWFRKNCDNCGVELS